MSEQARLRWRCRRGMKELDVILTRYLDKHFTAAVSSDKALFECLLEMQDPDLYNLLMGRSQAEDPALADFIRRLRKS